MRELCLLHGNGKRNGWPTGAKMPVRAAARSRRAALLSAVCLFALPSGFLARAMAATMANADCLDCHLDGRRGGDEWEHTKPIASALGFLFFGLGVILLVLIIYAMSGRLTHGIH